MVKRLPEPSSCSIFIVVYLEWALHFVCAVRLTGKALREKIIKLHQAIKIINNNINDLLTFVYF